MMRVKSFCLFVLLAVVVVACNTSDNKVASPSSGQNDIISLKQQIRKHPDSLMLKENLIEAYRNAGYYDSAITVADEEISKDSGSAYLWNIKATLYFENGDTMQAIQSLKRAIDIYPLPDYLVALGTVYAEIRDPRALRIADGLLRANKAKSGTDAYFIKGLYYNYTNEPSKAIPLLDSCLAQDFTYMYAYREKAIALYMEKKYDDAIRVLNRAVTIQNNFDEGYYWMGKCYEKLNKKDKAVQSYQSALLYDKDYVEARHALDRLQAAR